jgi:asparagine synthase (glutamine-hydrolysing)
LASKYVKVALSGDGSDEIFSGYNRYKIFNNFPNAPTNEKDIIKIDWEVFKKSNGAVSEMYRSILVDGLRDTNKKVLYSNKFMAELDGNWAKIFLDNKFESNKNLRNNLNRIMDVDCRFWLRDAQLVKVDIASMANSVEVRSPFLDHKLIEFATQIDVTQKLRGLNEKYILKEVAKRYLPDFIVNRTKQELSLPVEYWLLDNLKKEIQDVLLSERFLSRKYFAPDKMRDFVTNFTKNDSYAIWTLYIFEKWHMVNGL